KGLILRACDGAPHDRGSTRQGSVWVRPRCSLTLFQRFSIMEVKKRSARASRKPKPRPVADRFLPILSSAVGSLFNMTVSVVTSGTVLLCFFAAKDCRNAPFRTRPKVHP